MAAGWARVEDGGYSVVGAGRDGPGEEVAASWTKVENGNGGELKGGREAVDEVEEKPHTPHEPPS